MAAMSEKPSKEIIKYLLESKEIKQKLEAKDKHGWTALHGAAYFGSLEVSKELISQGADISAVTNDKLTVLHMTASSEKSNIKLVKYLLKNEKIKQLINAKNIMGLTAADTAFWLSRNEILDLLIKSGNPPELLLDIFSYIERSLSNFNLDEKFEGNESQAKQPVGKIALKLTEDGSVIVIEHTIKQKDKVAALSLAINSTSYNFNMIKIPGDGNCAVNSLGINRQAIGKSLLSITKNTEYTSILAPEIKDCFYSSQKDIFAKASQIKFTELSASYDKQSLQVDNLVRVIKAILPKEHKLQPAKALSLLIGIKQLNNDKQSSIYIAEDKVTKLEQAIKELDNLGLTITKFCRQADIVEQYIDKIVMQDKQWLGKASLYLYALLNNTNLVILHKPNKDNNTLAVDKQYSIIINQDQQSKYIIYQGGMHFDKLKLINSQQEQELIESLSKICANKNDSITTKSNAVNITPKNNSSKTKSKKMLQIKPSKSSSNSNLAEASENLV